jgi:hypothetical protein
LRTQFTVHFWLLKNGANAPAAEPHAEFKPGVIAVEPFDEYFFRRPDGSDTLLVFQSVKARLTGYAEELRENPEVVGYIIGYGSCVEIYETRLREINGVEKYQERNYQDCDKPGTGKKAAESEKKLLSEKFGIDRSRLRTIEGGFRSSQSIELWSVPAGEPPPSPSPTASPDIKRQAERKWRWEKE